LNFYPKKYTNSKFKRKVLFTLKSVRIFLTRLLRFSLKVSQNWEKYDYQRPRKRKYILFARNDSWSFKSKKVPCASRSFSIPFHHLR